MNITINIESVNVYIQDADTEKFVKVEIPTATTIVKETVGKKDPTPEPTEHQPDSQDQQTQTVTPDAPEPTAESDGDGGEQNQAGAKSKRKSKRISAKKLNQFIEANNLGDDDRKVLQDITAKDFDEKSAEYLANLSEDEKETFVQPKLEPTETSGIGESDVSQVFNTANKTTIKADENEVVL